MTEAEFFRALLYTWFALAGLVFVVLFFFTAPYGRHTRAGWGPLIDRRLGWVLMELPSALLFLLFYILGHRHGAVLPLIFLAMWQLHYLHRALIYPFQMRGARQQMTWLATWLGIIFNLGNGYINARFLFSLGPDYPPIWLADPRFIIGVALFAVGFIVNKHSDRILRNLRQPGDSDYKIPIGWLYRYISCPNYLGEIIQWFGWAMATWSLAGLSFAVWTVANLVPRAIAHHKWYRSRFPDYPGTRKAILPFIL